MGSKVWGGVKEQVLSQAAGPPEQVAWSCDECPSTKARPQRAVSEDSATRLAVATLIPPLPPPLQTPGSGLVLSCPSCGHDTQYLPACCRDPRDRRGKREAAGWATGPSLTPTGPRQEQSLPTLPRRSLALPHGAWQLNFLSFGYFWSPKGLGILALRGLLLSCGVAVQGLHSLHPTLPSPMLTAALAVSDGFGLCPLPLRDKVLLCVSSEQLHEVGRGYVTISVEPMGKLRHR